MRARGVNTGQLVYAVLLILVLATGYVALSAVSVGNQRPSTPIRLISGEWEPFIGPELEEDGPVARIVTETFQRIGYEPEIIFTSWDIILEQTERVEVLGAFPFILSEERSDNYEASASIIEFDYVLFYYEPNIPDESIHSLMTAEEFRSGGYTFGKVEGYEVWDELNNAQFDFVEYATSEEAFQKLVEGEIDFLAEGLLVGEVITRSADITADAANFRHIAPDGNPLLGATEELHLLMPKTDNSRRLLNAFDESLAAVKDTQVYREAEAEIASAGNTNSIVELQPSGGERLVSLSDDDGQEYLVPLGSQALVLDWSPLFSQPGIDSTASSSRVIVKLLNGPLRGRVMFVESDNVRLVAD